ncbi:Peptidoglycan hydrolase FlgJ [Fervidicola ferrireducens]|uniref:Peptidoglycan hydrolase FlgJ n=1 Tax=Fervidicola ferrireducens TaxID=520764 RepID=A0A140LBP9_9FIRM|nr:rod-binding protein [Fervidicola ferrireducens]KXG77974.1 Peptidoglycan hydrolase FlgJ [Fervidicola ferrireducens]
MKVETFNFAVSTGNSESQKAELKKACQQFEAIFLRYLLKEMRKTVPNGGLFGNSLSFNIFQSLYDDALSEELSRNKGIGIAEELYRQLSKYV